MRRRCVMVGWIAALGCGPQVLVPPGDDESTGAQETGAVETTATSSGGATTSTGPMSTSTSATTITTTETTTGVDPDTSTSTTITSESSSDESGCSPTDECSDDDDCGRQGTCIGCICIGGCELDGGGSYEGCVLGDGTIDTSVCNDDAAVCLVDAANPTAGACASPCTEVCDCPPLPGHDAQIGCGDLDGDGFSECFIGCAGRCPRGMMCTAEAVCMWPA